MKLTFSVTIKRILLLSSAVILAPAAQADLGSSSNTTVGSRLESSLMQSASGVQIYTRDEILQSGESNAADFIRNLPSNSFGSFRPQVGSTAQGDAAVSLRGVGTSKTLVLVDGRRLPKSPHAPAWQNLNMLPMGAIDRIEVMTEGGSALYGADAVGGVINVVTRQEYEGVELMLGTADVSFPSAGGEREEGSLVFGTHTDRSGLLAGISWNDREAVFQRDLPVDLSIDTIGNSFTTLTNGFDDFNFTALETACESLGAGFSLIENNLALNGLRCGFDRSSAAAEEPTIENKSMYVKANHQINDSWTLWASTSFNQVESFGVLSPASYGSIYSDPLSINSQNNPTNPNSPLFDSSLGLEPQVVNWWHRFAALGNRETSVTHQLLDFQVGAQAKLSWADLDFGFRHSDNQVSDVRRNYLLFSVAESLIQNGDYSLGNPLATPNDVLNTMRITLFREAKYDQDEWFGTISFEAFELPGGAAQMVVGAVYMEEEYYDLYDPQTAAGMVADFFDDSAGGVRETTALFLEAGLPINDKFNVNLAARFDDYSDVGSETATKFTAIWQPMDKLTIRGTFSQDHSTPDLQTLNQVPINRSAFTTPVVIPDAIRIANPKLRSEQVDQFNIDIQFVLSDQWQFNLGYWDLSLDDRIQYYSTFVLRNLPNENQQIPPGLSCVPDGQGGYSQCFEGYGNGGSLELDGVTLDVHANYELFGGLWKSHLQVTHINEIQTSFAGISSSTSNVHPSARGRLTNSFAIGDWQFAYHINHITGEQDEFNFFSVPSWTSHDVQINYQTPWRGIISVGAQNIGEELPKFDGLFSLEGDSQYNRSLYHAYGRIVYARYTQTF